MCRLACFPPFFPREKATEILLGFTRGKDNQDGVGYCHISDKRFVVRKWPTPLEKVVARRRNDFLGHMDGLSNETWTIAHVRAASHGENFRRNTHPFIVGDWAFMHNGVWSEYNIAKLLLEHQGIKFRGETDSEVAAHLWRLVGPRKFYYEMFHSGVFIGLKRNGKLYVAKTSGDLIFKNAKFGRLIVSESESPTSSWRMTRDVRNGVYCLSKYGQVTWKIVEPREKFPNYSMSTYSPATSKVAYVTNEYGETCLVDEDDLEPVSV